MTKVHGDPLFHVDYNAMVEGINQNGVLSGLAVSQKGAGADMSVDVATGSALIDEEKYTEAGVTNVAIDASEAGKHRKDTLIYDTATSAPIAIKGSSVVVSGNAVPPSVTADDILLAVVYIGDAVATITDANIYDGRIFISAIKDNWSAVTDPDNNDDTGDGYEIGSRWVNTSKKSFFVCVKATAGVAVWRGTYSTATSPATTDDDAHGFTIGSQWVDTAANKEFVCVDATTSAAVWIETTSQLQDDFLEIIRQMHPNVSILAAMDDATTNEIFKISDIYKLLYGTYDVYDEHNNNSVDTNLWTITTSGSGTNHAESVIEAGSAYLRCYVHTALAGSAPYEAYATAYVVSDNNDSEWHGRIQATNDAGYGTKTAQLIIIGSATHTYNIPQDGTYRDYQVYKDGGNLKIVENGTVKVSEADANSVFQIRYYANSASTVFGNDNIVYVYVDKTGKTGSAYGIGATSGDVVTDAIAANAAVLSFFSHLKGKFSNGASTHANPVQVEIYGNGDSYAAALNATTKFKIDVADPRIELYRIDDSVVAKSGAQTDWVLDDNATNGAFPTKTTSTHETILGEEIGCASVVMVEKSVNGGFTDTELLVEDDDYTVDYSTRTATKIILTASEAADIVISQSKLRITWIADVEDIEGTANTALKMKIFLNRTATTEASPEIQKIDLGTDKYAEMKYMCG
jgi:hypothetical protein